MRNNGEERKAATRRSYENRKQVGLCAYFGCRETAKSGRTLCLRHLKRMSRDNRKRINIRKRKGLCITCGNRPQFWGRRCVICRQAAAKAGDLLPRGARRALRLYREAEVKFETEQNQAQTRFAARKLMASEDVSGAHAEALRLHLGLDRDIFRTYAQVGQLMHISRERVRQLLYPAKFILQGSVGRMPRGNG